MAARTVSALPISTSTFPSPSQNNNRKPILPSPSSLSLPSNHRKPNPLATSLLRDPAPLSSLRAPTTPLFPRPGPPRSAAVFSMLPTAKLEGASTEKTPGWSARAIKSFSMAELEARKLKYPNTGTEALLMGILIEGFPAFDAANKYIFNLHFSTSGVSCWCCFFPSDRFPAFDAANKYIFNLHFSTSGVSSWCCFFPSDRTSEAAKFLRANGITLLKVREETVKLLGKSDMYFFSPEHPPLTEPAQRALDWAADEKLKSGDNGERTTAHLLLGIWSEKDSAGHKILASLGFDDDRANELVKSANEDAVMTYR